MSHRDRWTFQIQLVCGHCCYATCNATSTICVLSVGGTLCFCYWYVLFEVCCWDLWMAHPPVPQPSLRYLQAYKCNEVDKLFCTLRYVSFNFIHCGDSTVSTSSSRTNQNYCIFLKFSAPLFFGIHPNGVCQYSNF